MICFATDRPRPLPRGGRVRAAAVARRRQPRRLPQLPVLRRGERPPGLRLPRGGPRHAVPRRSERRRLPQLPPLLPGMDGPCHFSCCTGTSLHDGKINKLVALRT